MSIRVVSTIPALICLLIMMGPGESSAEVSLFGGLTLPNGDLDEGSDNGWTLGGYAVAELGETIGLGGTLAYSQFPTNDTSVPIIGEILGDQVNAWELHGIVQAKIAFATGFFGLGFTNHSGLDEELETKRDSDLGWQLGVGARIYVVELRLAFHQVDGDVATNWWSLTGGIVF